MVNCVVCGGKDSAREVSICCAVEKKENGKINGEGWKYGTRNGSKESCSQLCWSATQERVGLRFQNVQGM